MMTSKNRYAADLLSDGEEICKIAIRVLAETGYQSDFNGEISHPAKEQGESPKF